MTGDDNKQVVREFLEVMGRRDVEAMAPLLAEDVVRYGPRPSFLSGRAEDDTSVAAGPARGRARLLSDTAANAHYVPGTITIQIDQMVAEGDLVAAQFILRATTHSSGRYENYYHFLFEVRDGAIAAYWEYIDTLYSQRMLFGA
jgi:ketosteroid isomerase-like protein